MRHGCKFARLAAMPPSDLQPELFRPGWGTLPPYLAGRDAQQHDLKQALACLQTGVSPASGKVLIGPRGNGKTALLRWFKQEIERVEPGIDGVWLTPDKIPDLDALATELAPPERFQSLLPDTLSLSLGIGQLGWELGGRPASLTRLLAQRCRKTPLVVLLDEAQNLGASEGQALLNTAQEISVEAPFLLILAGTPNLYDKLNSLSATFWERCQPIAGIGRLDAGASAAALERPLAEQGISFTSEALEEVVAESQRYPYFLQLWGKALWDQARSAAEPTGKGVIEWIDMAVFAAARPEFERSKNGFYAVRYRQIEQSELLPAARTVALAFTERESLSDSEFRQAIADALPEKPSAEMTKTISSALQGQGYVWAPPDDVMLEPGIPSLMDYVLAKSAL